MAGTVRQRNKFAAFDLQLDGLCARLARVVESEGATSVNVLAVTRALNRYRHHRASIMAPAIAPTVDAAREGRFHVAWARIALKQAAALLDKDSPVKEDT